MKSRKKNQRKWESTNYKTSEDYTLSKKDKEYLSKYRNIAGEYLEDWEFIDLFKKNNYDDEQISKELNKIILGDDYKWKEIKNGKPVTTRSTDQIRKKQKYYKPEKTYNVREKTEGNLSKNKRKIKGSYHKNLNDFYHYVSKKPKRPFQKCIEVPSDYLPIKNNFNLQENENIIINTDDNINSDNNTDSNKMITSKSAINLINIDNNKINNNNNENKENKKTIKKTLPLNMSNKIEETKNDENENEKIISDEEQRKIILIKGEVFKNLKKLSALTENKNKNRQKQKDSSENRIKVSSENDSDYSLTNNKDIKNDKALQKKYLKIFFGNMNHYSKKRENNIKRANSKDSETSDDKPSTIKRVKKNNIPTSSNIIQKKSRAININNNSNININKNLKRTYDLENRNKDVELELESKVVDITINSCYDNPYRDQYLKYINEKRKKNPGKIVELIIPQFNNMFMPPYPYPYPYPYLNQNMFMYPHTPYQPPIVNKNSNNTPQNVNIPQYFPPMPQMNMTPLNQQINHNSMNSQINMQLNPQINNNKFIGLNNNMEISSNNTNREINSDNQINSMSDN